jgi:fructose-bisphosphate aldolase class 1
MMDNNEQNGQNEQNEGEVKVSDSYKATDTWTSDNRVIYHKVTGKRGRPAKYVCVDKTFVPLKDYVVETPETPVAEVVTEVAEVSEVAEEVTEVAEEDSVGGEFPIVSPEVTLDSGVDNSEVVIDI